MIKMGAVFDKAIKKEIAWEKQSVCKQNWELI